MIPVRVILSIGVLLLPACGRSEEPSGTWPVEGREIPPATVTVLAGVNAQLVGYLTPLAADPSTAAWYEDRLRALDPEGPKLWFYRLALFHLGHAGAADLPLHRLDLSVLVAGAVRHAVPLPTADGHPLVRASILPYRALDGYRGRTLRPGDSLVAITAFGEALELKRVETGTLLAGDVEISMRPGPLDSHRLARLMEFPRREDVLVGLAADADPGPSRSGKDERD